MSDYDALRERLGRQLVKRPIASPSLSAKEHLAAILHAFDEGGQVLQPESELFQALREAEKAYPELED